MNFSDFPVKCDFDSQDVDNPTQVDMKEIRTESKEEGNDDATVKSEQRDGCFGERRLCRELLSDVSAPAPGLSENHHPNLGQEKIEMEISGVHEAHPISEQDEILDWGSWNPFHSTPQSEINGGFARDNPFYAHFIGTNRKNTNMEDLKSESTEALTPSLIFAPPPEYQNSPLGLSSEIHVSENEKRKSLEPEGDMMQISTQSHNLDLFTISELEPAYRTHSRNETPNPSDAFDPTCSLLRDPWKAIQSNGTDLPKVCGEDDPFQSKTEDLFLSTSIREVDLFSVSAGCTSDLLHSQSDKHEDLLQSTHVKDVDPFPSPFIGGKDLFQAAKGGELFQSPLMEENIFPISSAKGNDLFDNHSEAKMDLFPALLRKTDDPFPSIQKNEPLQLNSDMLDPFKPTVSNLPRSYQESTDIFQHALTKTQDHNAGSFMTNSSDVFSMTPGNVAFINSQEMKDDIFTFSPAEKTSDVPRPTPAYFLPATHTDFSDKSPNTIAPTPCVTKHSILQPTPFSHAMSLGMSSSETSPETAYVTTFKRAPRPLPRTKPPRPPPTPRPTNPTAPDLLSQKMPPKPPPKPGPTPPPKPVIHITSPVQDSKPELEDCVVLDHILLIGQEKCVEDWPEDSPQLDPDFKPAGKYRLRRESLKMKKGDSDGGSGGEQDGSGNQWKRRGRKFKASILSRRGSKEKCDDDLKERKSGILPMGSKEKYESKDARDNNTLPRRSKDGHPETRLFSPGENEDVEQDEVDCKPKKPLKTKVSLLSRRASISTWLPDKVAGQMKHDEDAHEQKLKKNVSVGRRWSEGTVPDETSEEEEGEGDLHKENRRNRVKIKFVPQRRFSISIHKPGEDPKGAHGHTPHMGSKEKPQDEVQGAHGYKPYKKSQDDDYDDVEGAKGYTPEPLSKGVIMDDEVLKKGGPFVSPGATEDEDLIGTDDCKPRKQAMLKLFHVGRRRSKEEDLSDYTSPNKSTASAGDMEDDGQTGTEYCKLKQHLRRKGHIRVHQKPKTIQEVYHMPQEAPNGVLPGDDLGKGKDLFSPGMMHKDEEDWIEDYKLKKHSKLKIKMHKVKSKAMALEYENPPGATSSDYYLSEAAEAEWLAAQMDERLTTGFEEDEEGGDTDSLMEWWNTVEQWDEVGSDDEDKALKEDEAKSFAMLAEKVHLGLRVFNKVFTESAEVLWQYVIKLHAIADDISAFHKKAKIASITGGTTTAVGGVTAIAGLALAPLTFGASLIVTAVGVGVATAGGITSASATISDNVNNMQDRKKVEAVLLDYEAYLVDIRKILQFVDQSMFRIRGHPFLRAGTQHYSADWEVRKAVQMISLVDKPVMRAVEITDEAVVSVQRLFQGMDKFFLKDSRELKKGCKKEVVQQIKVVANNLNDGLVELNAIREELQEANGN